MLHLITGANGSGKTLRSIWRMVACQKQGMTVYAHGYRNLRLPGVQSFSDPREWAKLPPNSALFIDEAQKVWRARKGGSIPREVMDLETHRHGGVDIYLVTQSPKYIDAHIHELITSHEHLVAYSKTSSRVFKFNECRTNTKSVDLRAKAGFEVWNHPQDLYGVYDSAEVHTAKPKVPWRQRIGRVLFALAMLILVYVGWSIYGWFTADKGESSAGAEKSVAQKRGLASMFGDGSASEKKTFRNATDYLVHYKARVPTMPWSMPALDGQDPKAEPELFCMASGEASERSCSCLTEQGTRYLLPPDKCYYLARWGGSYNPFKEPTRREQLAGNRDDDSDDGATSHNAYYVRCAIGLAYCAWRWVVANLKGHGSRLGYEHLHQQAGHHRS